MKDNKASRGIGTLIGVALLALAAGLGIHNSVTKAAGPFLAEPLYIGDAADNSLKRFSAATGDFHGATVKSKAGLHGPRGLVLDANGNLIVADQNFGTSTPGEILLYSTTTGKLLDRVVAHSDPNAPAVPRGLIRSGHVIFVAELSTEPSKSKPATPGRLLAFTDTGAFVAELEPDPNAFPLDLFHPRALVIGPDGLLYVSNVPELPLPPAVAYGGQVLRFDPNTGAFIDVFLSDAGGVGQLNRPEGIVFGPDCNIYMTSFRADATDNDTIRVYQGPGGLSPGAFIGDIDLDVAGQPRAFAQALLFGPGGFLFVPITGNGPDSGSVRRYDVTTKTFDVFVPPGALGGPLEEPWYLTFGSTNPATLAYEGD
jgi:DNA-binding beta-propeller fold protein YncE